MDGLFNLANMLFGINVEPADGLAPVIIFYCFINQCLTFLFEIHDQLYVVFEKW